MILEHGHISMCYIKWAYPKFIDKVPFNHSIKIKFKNIKHNV